jgi:hypothetical protein
VLESIWGLCGKIEDWCPNIYALFFFPFTSIRLKTYGNSLSDFLSHNPGNNCPLGT